MSLGQTGPSFDDVPASVAPNKHVAASYAYQDQEYSGSPVLSGTDRRPSFDSLYRYREEEVMEASAMARNRSYERDGDLPRLQAQDNLEAMVEEAYRPMEDDDPTSYDLIGPGSLEDAQKKTWNLEKQSQALFSKEHLQVIFSDPGFLLKFTSFLGLHRPQSVPILVHYLDSLKALRALHYANAILEGLDEVPGLDFTVGNVEPTTNAALLKRASDAFDYLVREELPAYVTHEYVQVVSASISARISGMLAPHLREASEGLAEVFCLTDPSRADNPIVFASEEFNRTTQYGMSYVLGRNCRFLQGPYTNPLSVRRIRDSVKASRQHQEVFLNYRRDGTPFMNLLMTAPLCDSRGVVRYYIGAQVDVSGLVKDCAEMDSLARLLSIQENGEKIPDHQKPDPQKNDELRELSEMLNQNELSTIYRFGGRMHKETDGYTDDENESSAASNQPRLLIKDPDALTPPLDLSMRLQADGSPDMMNGYPPVAGSTTSTTSLSTKLSGILSGIYNHYLLIRPYPSLRILFASPSQRIPGILQSPFMNKIGGSNRVREELTAALADGRGVTAKVRWVSRGDEEGRNRWIHCTPLVGLNGQIGVWMVVIVDDERHKLQREQQRIGMPGRMAPPIAQDTRSRERDRATPEQVQKASNGQSRLGGGLGRSGNAQGSAQGSGSSRIGSTSATAGRYEYSAGDRGATLPDRSRKVPDTRGSLDGFDGGGSVQSFRI